jgi:hypothetical protein
MPSNSQIHQNKALENISVGYKVEGFIAEKLSPSIPVKHESDKYYVFSKDSMRLPETLRADGSEAREADFNVSTATYQLDEHSLRKLVTDRQRANADKAIRPDIEATEYLTEKILLRREKSLLDLVNDSSNWTSMSLTSAQNWGEQTITSNPIVFIDTASSTILAKTGKKANVVALSHNAFVAAKNHPSIKDQIKYTSAESVTPDMLAKLFSVDEVAVSSSHYNAGSEGLADSIAPLMTDCAFVMYKEKNPGRFKPSAFYTFEQGENASPYSVRKWRDDTRKGDYIEVSSMFKHQIISSDCALHIAGVI